MRVSLRYVAFVGVAVVVSLFLVFSWRKDVDRIQENVLLDEGDMRIVSIPHSIVGRDVIFGKPIFERLGVSSLSSRGEPFAECLWAESSSNVLSEDSMGGADFSYYPSNEKFIIKDIRRSYRYGWSTFETGDIPNVWVVLESENKRAINIQLSEYAASSIYYEGKYANVRSPSQMLFGVDYFDELLGRDAAVVNNALEVSLCPQYVKSPSSALDNLFKYVDTTGSANIEVVLSPNISQQDFIASIKNKGDFSNIVTTEKPFLSYAKGVRMKLDGKGLAYLYFLLNHENGYILALRGLDASYQNGLTQDERANGIRPYSE